MAKNKTGPTTAIVTDFINAIQNETKRKDGFTILNMYNEITKLKPVMWGPSIIGYGYHHYVTEKGHEGEMPIAGFSPRTQHLVLYVLNKFKNQDDLLERLGKHKTGKICLYINKLSDINLDVLKEIIQASFDKDNQKQSSS